MSSDSGIEVPSRADGDSVEVAHVAGFCIRVTAEDAPTWRDAAAGKWEPETLGVLGSVKPGEVVIDVGAYRGVFTAIAACMGARVHAYEPDPVARAALERMLDLNPAIAARVVVHPEALGGGDRAAKLSSERLGNSGSSLR